MKRKITMVFIIAIVAGGMVGFAGDGNDDKRHRNNRCNPAGTWYAELPSSPPYMATITPIQGHSRYSAMYQGLFNAWDLSSTYAAMTDFSGELVKSGDGYDVAIIGILGGGEGMPFWYPLEIWGVKGHIEFREDCNTMDVTWVDGLYIWVWDPAGDTPIPWDDDADFIAEEGYPLTETYHRMIMPTD